MINISPILSDHRMIASVPVVYQGVIDYIYNSRFYVTQPSQIPESLLNSGAIKSCLLIDIANQRGDNPNF